MHALPLRVIRIQSNDQMTLYLSSLPGERDASEQALADTVAPLEVVVERLTPRGEPEGSGELACDAVDAELKTEAKRLDSRQQ